jgi:hypothetical protein
MTTSEYIAKLKKKLEILKEGKLVQIAATDTHDKMVERIFEKNLNELGNKIGEYSKNPIYVDPKDSPRSFPTKGKNGKEKFKNGKDHKTGYFKNYSDYKKELGRSGEVDLKLHNRLKSDFEKGVVKESALKYTSGVNKDNADKIKGIESNFGSVFDLTKNERENFTNVLEFETLKLLK